MIMKRKLASFVVDHRRAVFALMLVIAAVSAFLITKVEINEDMTRYLPEKSTMKQGIDIMSDEFPEAQTSQTIRVMFDHLMPEEKEGIRASLQSIPYVTDVAWQADLPDYNRDEHTLYVISTNAGYKSAEMKAIKKSLDHDFSGYQIAWHDDDVGTPEVPAWILLSGVAAILLILLVMCESWIEPFLFLDRRFKQKCQVIGVLSEKLEYFGKLFQNLTGTTFLHCKFVETASVYNGTLCHNNLLLDSPIHQTNVSNLYILYELVDQSCMVLLTNLSLDNLAGNLHCHATDFVLDFVNSLSALKCDVRLGTCLHGNCLLRSFPDDLVNLTQIRGDSKKFLVQGDEGVPFMVQA